MLEKIIGRVCTRKNKGRGISVLHREVELWEHVR
jgi:hypothetical protein